MTETLERYIKFAIENGYNIGEKNALHSKEWRIHNGESDIYLVTASSSNNVIEIITSKDFINAIILNREEHMLDELASMGEAYSDLDLSREELFTIVQALAIYNGTLEEFINNLLPKE